MGCRISREAGDSGALYVDQPAAGPTRSKKTEREVPKDPTARAPAWPQQHPPLSAAQLRPQNRQEKARKAFEEARTKRLRTNIKEEGPATLQLLRDAVPDFFGDDLPDSEIDLMAAALYYRCTTNSLPTFKKPVGTSPMDTTKDFSFTAPRRRAIDTDDDIAPDATRANVVDVPPAD